MKPQLPPPWMLGTTEVNNIPMLIVHMSNGELEGLDDLQGGPSEDESTGIREYSKLADIIEIPEIKQLFLRIANDIRENKGTPSEDTTSAYKIARKHSLPYRETDEEEHNPLKALEHKGRGGDTKLAELPYNFVDFLMSMGFSVNPKTELLEFGFFDELLRIGGTIAGALLGGPTGAGLGNALASTATGKSLKDSVVSGIKNAALTYGAQGLGQAAGLGNVPGIGGLLGGASHAAASMMPGINAAGAIAPNAMPAAQAAAQPGFFDHILGTAGKLAPYAPLAMAGLSYMGAKKHHQHATKEKEKQDAKWEEERKRKEWMWEPQWHPREYKKLEPNPEFYNRNEEDIRHGRLVGPAYREIGTSGRYATGGLVQSYNQGTLVRGKGKGQDDYIKTRVPAGSYIIDASTTSMLGDGSSTAGAKVLKEFETKVKKSSPKEIINHVKKTVRKESGQVPVWLSDSEYKFDPTTVALLGRGSNEHGADILRNTVKNIRKHKTIKGDGLPPKAKPLVAYMR